jgi:hypothetical protein
MNVVAVILKFCAGKPDTITSGHSKVDYPPYAVSILRLSSAVRWRAATSSRARRFASMRTWEYRASLARDTCPAMLMIPSSPAPDSASSVTSVWRLSCHRPTTFALSRTFVQAVHNVETARVGPFGYPLPPWRRASVCMPLAADRRLRPPPEVSELIEGVSC